VQSEGWLGDRIGDAVPYLAAALPLQSEGDLRGAREIYTSCVQVTGDSAGGKVCAARLAYIQSRLGDEAAAAAAAASASSAAAAASAASDAGPPSIDALRLGIRHQDYGKSFSGACSMAGVRLGVDRQYIGDTFENMERVAKADRCGNCGVMSGRVLTCCCPMF
jgi:hypothetical protein